MNKEAKKKLCWNCEGNVDQEAVQCQYCGVTLTPSYGIDDNDAVSSNHFNSQPPPPIYSSSTALNFENKDNAEAVPEDLNNSKPGQIQASIPFALLLCGIVLFLFALMLLFFSKNGVLTLKWDASYWFVYLLFSAPLLYLGWRLLNNNDNEGEEQ